MTRSIYDDIQILCTVADTASHLNNVTVTKNVLFVKSSVFKQRNVQVAAYLSRNYSGIFAGLFCQNWLQEGRP